MNAAMLSLIAFLGCMLVFWTIFCGACLIQINHRLSGEEGHEDKARKEVNKLWVLSVILSAVLALLVMFLAM